MKNTFKISILAAGVCFLANVSKAQLASSAPAMTVAQMEALKKAPATNAPVAAVQTASSSKASAMETVRTDAQTKTATPDVQTASSMKPEAAKTAPATEATPVKISDQGGVTPVDAAPVTPVLPSSEQGAPVEEKASKKSKKS